MEAPPLSKDMPVPPAQADEYREIAWAKPSLEKGFEPIFINRPKPTGKFVKFEMKYCGICHTDIHMSMGELGPAMCPVVPGHELCGVVTEVGSDVTKFKVGDKVGVGCIIDSCLDCEMCGEGDE